MVSGLEWFKSRAGADRSSNGGYTKGEQAFRAIFHGAICHKVLLHLRYLQDAFPNAGDGENPKAYLCRWDCGRIQQGESYINIRSFQLSGGKVVINGELVVNGLAEFNGSDVTHKGKSIGKDHSHKGVQTGSGNTGAVN